MAGRRKGGELRAVESGTALCSAKPLHYHHRNTHTSTHALHQHDLCPTVVLLECRLSPPPTTLSVSPLLDLQNREREKGEAASSDTRCGFV